MDSVHGVTCIKGEIHSIMTLMRLSTRWSHVKQKVDVTIYQDENPLVKAFRRLNEYLEGIFDLKEVDCVMYIAPFHQVIVSDQASGPLTSAALSSLSKFVLYGFLRPTYPRVGEGIGLIAACIENCKFEETDWESDEVILMKLLELSALVFRCEAANLLTVGAVWDIYSTCISIHSQRASKILRSEAESTLRHLTLTAFSKIKFSLSTHSNVLIDHSIPSEINIDIRRNDDGHVLSGEFKDNSWDIICKQMDFAGPVGLTMLLAKIMSVLSTLMDLQSNSIEEVKFSLSLVNIALEAGGPALSCMGPLVDVLRGDVCRHLLRASQSEDLAIFSLALRVVFNLFMSIKDHMKVQLEVFFSSVHLRLLQSNGQLSNQQVAALSAREELALESLLEFCREPSLMYDLYTNYDCDVQCTNLFDSIITTLCTRAVPTIYLSCTKNDSIRQEEPLNDIVGMVYAQNERHSKVNILNKLALDGVFAVLHTVAVRCSNVEIDMKQESTQSLLQSSSQNSLNQTENLLTNGVLRYGGREILDNPPLEIIEMQIDQWCSTSEPGTPPLNDIAVNNDAKVNFKSDKDIPGLVELRSSNSVSPAPIIENLIVNYPGALPTEGTSSLPNSNSNSNIGNSSEDPDFVFLARSQTSDLLRERKLKKQMLRLVTEKFNEAPFKMEWIKLALDLDLLQAFVGQSTNVANPSSILNVKVGKNMEETAVEAKTIAKFLKLTPGLGKSQIGEYLSKGPKEKYPFHAEVLKEYVGTFDFSEKNSNNKVSFVNALRHFLGHFRLPGEAQCIDRLMEAFAVRLYEYLGFGNPFKNSDAAFVLAFSTIMLNTDLHSHQIQHNKRMTKEQFINNNRKINDNEDLPKAYLESLYDEIKSKQLQVDVDINDTGLNGAGGGGLIDFTDTATWNKLLRKSAMDQAPAAFTPTVAARRLTSGTGGLKSQYTLPLSIHEKDMFLVMAKPVLETMIIIWEISDDDRIIRRILEGIWDYAAVCVGLNLAQLLGEMIALLSLRARVILTLSRHKTSNESHTQSSNYSIIDTELRKLFQSGISCDIISLVSADFHNLITSNRSSSSFKTSSESYNWTGANIIKGELMIKAIFYITNKFTSYLDHDSWLSVYKLLLWTRGRGLLPRSLASVTEISQYLSNDSGEKKENNLEVSLYALKCIENAKNKKYKQAHNQKQSWWSSFIFGSVDAGASTREYHRDKALQVFDVDGNAGIYKLDQKQSRDTGERDENTHRNKVVGDEYLRHCLLHSKVDLGIFQLSFRWEDGFLNMSVISILTMLSDLLTSIVSSNTEQSDIEESEDILFLKFQFEGIEMDAVVLLEWLSHICVSNRHRIYIIWPKVHNFLVEISEERLEDLHSCCPYFLERCIVLILRSITATIEYTCGNISDLVDAQNPNINSSETIVLDTLNSMWSSLRLLRGFPSQLLNNIADKLAVGVLSLMQCYHNILFKGEGIAADIGIQEYFGIEQWCMIFSLLSGATCSFIGRPYVWDTICYIIDNNLVTELNYSPCRQLVLRFIHGAFLGEEEEKENEENDEIDESNNNLWRSSSLMYLVRLTNMVLGGYILITEINDRLESNVNGSTPTKAHDNKIVTFSLPPVEKKLYKVLSPILEIKNLPKPGADSSSNKFIQSGTMDVTVVMLKSVKEIETLWLETSKSFANMVNTVDTKVAYRALYCIQAVILAGETVGLSDSSWFETLQELMTILPINFVTLASSRDNSIDPKLKYELLEICLRSCNLIFEMIVCYLKHLRNVNEFPSVWLRFISVLANNVNVVQKNAALHEEILEMIVALLRLLHPPALPSSMRETVNVPTISSSNSKSQNSFLGLLASAIFDEPKQLPPTSPLMVISPSVNNKTPLCGGGVTGDESDDAALLALTWTNISAICTSLVPSLKVKNAQLVNDMLRYIEQFENSRLVAPKSDDMVNIANAPNISDGNHVDSTPMNRHSTGRTLVV